MGSQHVHHTSSGNEMLLSARKPRKLRSHDKDTLFHVDGLIEGTFAVALNKKQLRSLMSSDVDVLYAQNKGKLYYNANGDAKGCGKKKIGGLIASFKTKPQLTAEHISGMTDYGDDALTGGLHHDGPENTDETSMQTMFSSKNAAKAAAENFGCKGAHSHGDGMWMPCSDMADMVMLTDNHSGNNDHNHSMSDHSNINNHDSMYTQDTYYVGY